MKCVIKISNNYSPFGVQLSGRNFTKLKPGSTTEYIDDAGHGFQGQEEDDEVKGEGNSYDFGARFHDARLGRWLSLDAYASKYPNMSPYSFAANSPIMCTDVGGDSVWVYSNTIDAAYGFGRHMFIRVKTGDIDVLIEMSGPAAGQKVGQVKVSDWTPGHLTGRSNVLFHQVLEPIHYKNKKRVKTEKFEEDILKYAKHFEKGNKYDSDMNVVSNKRLPNYDKISSNSNGFARSLIEYAGGDVEVKPTYTSTFGLPEFLPGAAWGNLEPYFKTLRTKYTMDEYFKNTFGMKLSEYKGACHFADVMNQVSKEMNNSSDCSNDIDNTRTDMIQPVYLPPLEKAKAKSAVE